MRLRFVLHRVMATRDIRHIKEVAEITGVGRSTVSKIYNNQTKGISLLILAELCKGLECDPGDLFEYVRN